MPLHKKYKLLFHCFCRFFDLKNPFFQVKKPAKALVFGIIFSFFPIFLFAQTATDSVLVQARAFVKKEDYTNALRYYLQAVRIEENKKNNPKLSAIYTEMAELYQEGNLYAKSADYLQKAYALNPSDEIALKIADLQMQAQLYDSALVQYQKIAEKYEQQQNLAKLLPVLRKMVMGEQKLKNYEKALLLNQKIFAIQEKNKNRSEMIIAKNNIGYTQKKLGKYQEAVSSFQEVLKWENESEKDKNNTTTLINLGVTYQNIGNYTQSLQYLLVAKDRIEQGENKREMAQMYDLLSALYYKLKDYYNAKYYNELAVEFSKESGDKRTLSKAYQTTSLLYQNEEKYDKALEFFKQHLDLRDSMLVEDRLKQQNLEDQQFVIERTENELKLLMASEDLKDAQLKEARAEAQRREKENEILLQEQKLKNALIGRQEAEKQQALQSLVLLQSQAEAERKDKEITNLQKDQALKGAEIEKKNAEQRQKQGEIELLNKDKKLKDLELKRNEEEIAGQKERQNALYGIIGLGILVLILILIGLWITNKKNNQLAEQKNTITEKNAELSMQNAEIAAQRDNAEVLSRQLGKQNEQIKSSITYAQRIQKAILPLSEEIEKYLPRYFVLFQPRDIVSGDFYFFAHAQNKSLIAAVDCTGHGVPGAFMSMIGNALLNEIIISQQTTSPDLILNELHKGIRKALRQADSSNKDGMDMTLLAINKKEQVVEFAGAKNPLIYIQNGELQHIKGDKFPIGGEQREEERIFAKHTIKVDSPTMFYIFTDGYQDQFGGEKNQKFMISNLKKLFFEIHQDDLEKQRLILEKTIRDWIKQGKEHQIDDVLMIGVWVEKNSTDLS